MEDTHWERVPCCKVQPWVLILVLMEDTHWEEEKAAFLKEMNGLNPCFNGRYSLRSCLLRCRVRCRVLILVLMEDTHWGLGEMQIGDFFGVLILVLMEDTHWADLPLKLRKGYYSLNPCFNGRYSLSEVLRLFAVRLGGLNPCFNGRYSLSKVMNAMNNFSVTVLILVLMEDTHWVGKVGITLLLYSSLNPCFNGRYSLR